MQQSNRYRLKPHEIEAIQRMRQDIRNVLVIGDLHEPFCLDSYLDFCLQQQRIHNCTDIVFIGDIIDNHYSSYHETSADGMGGADELELAIKRIARWYNAFPVATVIIGNHDRMIMRKAQTSAIPSKWIKSYKEVLEVPNWNFVERYELDGVQYIHGEGGTARSKCRADMMNTVQGHLHTQAYCEHYVGKNFRVFGIQTGCGINHTSYAMAYAKYGKKPAVGVAVIKNNGTLPINVLMTL
tara:strand:- start:26 stop:745 length:720 start_codon:yes stop_codon:yes gene_type:complete